MSGGFYDEKRFVREGEGRRGEIGRLGEVSLTSKKLAGE